MTGSTEWPPEGSVRRLSTRASGFAQFKVRSVASPLWAGHYRWPLSTPERLKAASRLSAQFKSSVPSIWGSGDSKKWLNPVIFRKWRTRQDSNL